MRHPLTGAIAHTFRVRAGGVATSGIDARLWERQDGDFAHHLIDPATGIPAWTGLVAATALAPTALEAEALAKAALLSGPAAGRRLLRPATAGCSSTTTARSSRWAAAARRAQWAPVLPQVALP